MSIAANLSANRDAKQTLIVVFLRGGADGLTVVAPVEDDNYQRFRPRLAVRKSEAVPLDGRFGLHPNLRPLEAAWKEGDLAIIHAAGGESDSRSHFEAQDMMEHGGIAAGGWLGRYLRGKGPSESPLGAVALAPTIPEALSGAPSAAAFLSLDEFGYGKRGGAAFDQQLRRLYDLETDDLRNAAVNTFEAIRRIESIDRKGSAANGANYDDKDDFARGLRQVAQLIKADVGLDVASVDLNGWDSHFTQKTLIEPLMTRLGSGLAAFRQDMGARMQSTTVVVMTEFGRTVQENSAFGTDHGRGSFMFVLGGGVRGGRIHGAWQGLAALEKRGSSESYGDLPVLNNYRDILAPVLLRHGLAPEHLGKVFPEFTLNPLPLYHAA
jgi:uncharacterized protein (DUF1501 family)